MMAMTPCHHLQHHPTTTIATIPSINGNNAITPIPSVINMATDDDNATTPYPASSNDDPTSPSHSDADHHTNNNNDHPVFNHHIYIT